MYEDGPGAGASRTSGGPRRTIDLVYIKNCGLVQGAKIGASQIIYNLCLIVQNQPGCVCGGGREEKNPNQRGVHYFPRFVLSAQG